jgi:hypothetical protein
MIMQIRQAFMLAGSPDRLRLAHLEALLNEAYQAQYGIVDLLDSDRWSRVSSRDQLEAREALALDCEEAARGGDV